MIKSFFKNNYLFFLVFLAAFVFRILMSQYGDNYDLYANAGWGKWLYDNGPKGFYENNVWIYAWPTQPPLINLINGFNYYLYEQKLLWYLSYFAAVISTNNIFPQYFTWLFDLVRWFGTDLFKDTPFRNGFLVSMKVLPILSDLIIALVIYFLGGSIANRTKGLSLAALFLFLPFTWYVSSVWGQYDQVSSVLVLLTFLLLYKKYFMFSAVLFLFSGQIKPTTIMFIPLYIFYFLYQRPTVINMISSLIGVFGTFWLITKPFTDINPFIYTMEEIYPLVFNPDRYGLVNHAFNFWQLLAPFGGWSTTFYILGIQALYWGYLSLVILNITAIKALLKNKSFYSLIVALYIVSAGSYLFITGMVDRYFFPAMIFLTILTFYKQQLFKWWLITAVIFSFNLYYTWGFPFLTDLTRWTNPLVIRVFSLMNILVFLIILYELGVIKVQKLSLLLQKK